jgi:purine-nucleoside phosphorylase
MPIHLHASADDIAPLVLLPGDPQRAAYIAERFFDAPRCYTEHRGLLGFSGTVGGRPVSVQATGMGTPSIAIVLEELRMLGARTLVRLGTCGAIDERRALGDLLLVTAAHADPPVLASRLGGASFSAAADFGLLRRLARTAEAQGVQLHTGTVLTSDTFYDDDTVRVRRFAGYGTLAVEMECYALLAFGARHRLPAAALLTVSDLVFERRRAEPDVIRAGVDQMTALALAALA